MTCDRAQFGGVRSRILTIRESPSETPLLILPTTPLLTYAVRDAGDVGIMTEDRMSTPLVNVQEILSFPKSPTFNAWHYVTPNLKDELKLGLM